MDESSFQIGTGYTDICILVDLTISQSKWDLSSLNVCEIVMGGGGSGYTLITVQHSIVYKY